MATRSAVERPESLADVLARGRVRGSLRLLGPAFVAAIAYVDPGNFATNIAAGARYGYLLLWVIVAANLMAVVVQYLSSKVGLVTGRSLPELCRDRYPAPVRVGLWLQAEVVAIATDLAEFLGAAIAFGLLFGWPPLVGGLVTAVLAILILGLRRRGFRGFELAIGALLGVIVAGFAVSLALVSVAPDEAVGGLVPRFDDADSVGLAVGILGATVMPHVVYLHSALTADRVQAADAREVSTLLRFSRLDVTLAMLTAGAVNVAMLLVAAAAFHGGASAAGPVETLEDAFHATAATVGAGAAIGFAVALLASGLSSSSVGTMAGQVVMQGFVGRRIPLGVRRAVTIAPAIAVLALGVEPTLVLIVSQVVLSFGIPFALVPLVAVTASPTTMGEFANRRALAVAAIGITLVVVALNAFLLATVAGS
jgi:manganese transport protein